MCARENLGYVVTYHARPTPNNSVSAHRKGGGSGGRGTSVVAHIVSYSRVCSERHLVNCQRAQKSPATVAGLRFGSDSGADFRQR